MIGPRSSLKRPAVRSTRQRRSGSGTSATPWRPARGHRAVERVDPELDAAHEVVDLPDPEQVARAVVGQDGGGPVDHLVHLRLLGAERAADRDPGVPPPRRARRLDPQVAVDAALDDRVDELAGRPCSPCQARQRSSQRWVRSVERWVYSRRR
jgi:hypothetical protein